MYTSGLAAVDRSVGVAQYSYPPRIDLGVDLLRSAPVSQADRPPPAPPPVSMTQARAAKPHRFYWIRTTRGGPWIAAQAAYSDPAAGFFIPGVARAVFATFIGDEIQAPEPL